MNFHLHSQLTGRNREPSPVSCRPTQVAVLRTVPGATRALITRATQQRRQATREVSSRD
jgi:hypothetical protein